MYSTKFLRNILHKNFIYRNFSSRRFVLGIETSCDDTGAAVVDDTGAVLGEGFESQMKIHLENGGVIPHIAIHFHKENIQKVVSTALMQSNISFEDLSAIAVTTKPGLRGSLKVGIEYAKKLSKMYRKPLMSIHHMEAHALTVRLVNDIQLPFLCLLASGGHCQLALVKGLNEFFLLGESHHNAPGEVLDKVARRLKLQNLPEFCNMSGGKAIDTLALRGNPLAYEVPLVMPQIRDCNFSFSGFVSWAATRINIEEEKYNVAVDGVIPVVADVCASLLHGYARHLAHRVQRAFLFCEQHNLLHQRVLVFSGGVACSQYLKSALQETCITEMGAQFIAPPAKLCTDNGVMIAWNAVEQLKANIGLLSPDEDLNPQPNCPLGVDIRESVKKADIKVKAPKCLTVKRKEELSSLNSLEKEICSH